MILVVREQQAAFFFSQALLGTGKVGFGTSVFASISKLPPSTTIALVAEF
jgi:hypothetical protein